jgi:MSHA biogenesis protein MshG
MFNRISYSDKMLFAKHLAIMLRSGIPISDGVTTLYEQTTNKSFKKVLKKVLTDIENGHSVTDALGKHPKVFDPLYISFVKTGEESGKLPENLEYLADQLKKTNEFRKKVQSALLYPAFVIGTAIVVGGGISFFVLPQLIPLFDSLDVKLPLSTRILLGFATIMKNYWPIIIAAIVGLIIALQLFIKTKQGKLLWHKALIRLPIVGQNYSKCPDVSIMPQFRINAFKWSSHC